MAKFLDGIGLTDLLNKIKNAFVAKADTTEITSVGIDSTPTTNSTNLVTSGGVAAALEDIPSTYAGSPSAGGPANKTLGIPYGEVDSGSTATNIKASVDNFPTTLVAGVCAYIRNDVVASASGWTLNINGTGAKPVYASNADASRVTTLFSAATTFLFVYNPTRVSGGCWDMYFGYNANDNTIGYLLRTNGAVPPTASKFYRYRLLFTSDDCQSLIPANTSSSTSATAAKAVNQAKINPFAPIYYYSTTTAINANSAPGAAYSWLQYSGIALGYSFNRTGAELTMTAKDPVFLKCAPQADGSAIMDADNPIVQALPSTEDGKIYIYLGIAESATAITLYYWHPIYYYKDGAIRVWTNANEIVVDSTPTQGSTNPVTSGGVYATLADKADDSDVVHVTGDETIEGDKKFFDDVIVSNQAQGTDGEATIELQASSSSIAAHKYYSAETAEDFSWINWSGTYSPFPPGPGAEPVTHTKTLQQALNERNNPTIDSTPTSGSTNPVSSGGVKTYVDDSINNIQNPDWDEIDTSSAAYVKNRTHYRTPMMVAHSSFAYDNQSINTTYSTDKCYFDISNSDASDIFPVVESVDNVLWVGNPTITDCIFKPELEMSSLYGTVTFSKSNIVISSGKTIYNSDNADVCIIADSSVDSGTPYLVINYSPTSQVSGYPKLSGTFTMPSTKNLSAYVYMPLDGRYIPVDNDSIILDSNNNITVNNNTIARKATQYTTTTSLPYLAIELRAADTDALFIRTVNDGTASSFYVFIKDQSCNVIGDFDSEDTISFFHLSDYTQISGFNNKALIISTTTNGFEVLNIGRTDANVKLVNIDENTELIEFKPYQWKYGAQNVSMTSDGHGGYEIYEGAYSDVQSLIDSNQDVRLTDGYSYFDLIKTGYQFVDYDGILRSNGILFGKKPIFSDYNSGNYIRNNELYFEYVVLYMNDSDFDSIYTITRTYFLKPPTSTIMAYNRISPGIYYNLGELSSATTFTLNAASSPADEYMIQFSTGSTAPTITWPSGITWFGGSAPTINANKTYQISIQNNLAVCGEF